MGCADAYVLSLRRDGHAALTRPGNARQGTSDQTLHGRIGVKDFDTLARLAVAQGFFAMKDSYEDPSLTDGAWTTTTVARGAEVKQVFTREDAGPEALRTLQAALAQARAGIDFRP